MQGCAKRARLSGHHLRKIGPWRSAGCALGSISAVAVTERFQHGVRLPLCACLQRPPNAYAQFCKDNFRYECRENERYNRPRAPAFYCQALTARLRQGHSGR